VESPGSPDSKILNASGASPMRRPLYGKLCTQFGSQLLADSEFCLWPVSSATYDC
jgi:hypothetical protein